MWSIHVDDVGVAHARVASPLRARLFGCVWCDLDSSIARSDLDLVDKVHEDAVREAFDGGRTRLAARRGR